MKSIKLTVAALLSSALCLLYYSTFQPEALEDSYHCLRHVRPVSACYLGGRFETDFFGMVYVGERGNWIDDRVMKYGAYEKPELYFLRSVIDGGIFLDVGANTGQHSLFMSRHAKEIHAFEPYEPVLIRFRETVKVNRIRNIAIHPVGLGNEDAKLPFYEPPADNLGIGSFVPGWNGGNPPQKELSIVNGDRELRRLGIARVDLIKMDIEGYEKPALLGLRSMLKTSRPIVVFEMSTGENNPVRFENLADVEKIFPEHYGFLVLEDVDYYNGAYRLRKLEHVFPNEQHNVVAYPLEKKARIVDRGA